MRDFPVHSPGPQSGAPLHVVYVSELAPSCDFTAYAAICRTSRACYARAGISGMLLFDGLQFVQWLFGPSAAVAQLMETIARDARYRDLRVVYESAAAPLPPPPAWRAGFVGPEAIESFVASFAAAQVSIVKALGRLIEQGDFEPEVAREPSILQAIR